MPISEDRLQVLLPRRLKTWLHQAARRRGLSTGEYVRRLIDADLKRQGAERAEFRFPFGEKPIRTGRKHGSTDHDRLR